MSWVNIVISSETPQGGTIPVYTTDTSRFRLMGDATFRSLQQRLKDIALHHPGQLYEKEQLLARVPL